MTISKLAPAKPTAIAAATTIGSCVTGSASPSQVTAATTISAVTSNQARRWPINAASTGSRTRSITGAHSSLRLYISNASAKAVTVFFSMPLSASRVVSVAAIIAIGNPDAMPSNNAPTGPFSR